MSSMTASIYIPIIRVKTTEEFIKNVFQYKNIGEVQTVDFVFNKVKQRYEAFVDFKIYEGSQEATDFINSIENLEEQTKLFYNENNFWPILKNRNPGKKVVNHDYINTSDIIEENNKLKKENERLTKLVAGWSGYEVKQPEYAWADDPAYQVIYPPIRQSNAKYAKSR